MSTGRPLSSDPVFPGTGVSKDVLAAFWDMENVPVQSGISPLLVVRMLRYQLGRGYKDVDLNLFCNVSRVRNEIVSELLKDNVTLVHTQVSGSKEKLRFMLPRFLNRRQFRSLHVVLISDDIDLLALIEKAERASAISVILATNRPIYEIPAVSFCTSRRFSCFVTSLQESYKNYNKRSVVPGNHKTGPYDFWTFGPVEISVVDLQNQISVSEMPWEEDSGDRNADTVIEQRSSGVIKAVTRESEAEIKSVNECIPWFYPAAEIHCRAEPGGNLKSNLESVLKEENVVLLLSTPGSGSGFEAASCAQQLGHRVLSIQPTDTEARLCTMYARYRSQLKNVDCWLFHGQKVDPKAAVVFTTASLFFQLSQNTGEEVAGFQTIIVDGINEDNIYQRVILKFLHRYLQLGVTLIFCSRGLDIPLFLQESFHLGDENTVNCDVRFPVHVIWKEPSQDKLCTCIEAILDFCGTESPGGDILVFVPTVVDAFEAKASLEQRLFREGRLEGFLCEVMYAGIIPLKTIEASSCAIWKVYFTVDCPDVSASVLSIRCIVDCGLVSTTAFEGGIFIKEFRPLCAAEAEERRSLAALHGEGSCYRVYSERELLSSCPSSANNLRYIEDVVLRISARRTEATAFLLEDVPKQFREDVLCGLQEVGAIDKKGQVTDLGERLCLTSAEPRFAKLIFGSLGRLPTQDAILLSILAFEDLRAAYTSLRKECGPSQVRVTEDSCEFVNIIETYKAWCAVPKRQKRIWCNVNMLNELFFDDLHSRATCAYTEFLKLRADQPLQTPLLQHKYSAVTIGTVLSECFPSGLLQVTKQGCQHPTLGRNLEVSRFSSLRHKLQPKGTVICWLFAQEHCGRELQVMNACTLPGGRTRSTDSSNASHSNDGTECMNIHQEAVPVGPLLWNGKFGDLHIGQLLEDQLQSSNQITKEEGSVVPDMARQRVLLVGTKHYCAIVGDLLRGLIDKQLKELKNEEQEALLTTTMSPFGMRPVRACIGNGGIVSDVVSSAAFRTIVVEYTRLPVAEIQRVFQEFGCVVKFECVREENVCYITYKTAGEANAAYNACRNNKSMTVQVKGQALSCRNMLAERNMPFKIVVFLRCQGNTLSAPAERIDEVCFNRVQRFRPLGTPIEHCQPQENVASQQNILDDASTSTPSILITHVGEKSSLDIKSQSLAQWPKREPLASDWDTVSCNITKLLSSELGPQMPEFRIEDPMSPDGYLKGYLLFRHAEAAETALALLLAEQNFLYPAGSQSGTAEHTSIEVFVEGTFFFPRACFAAIEEEFLNKVCERKKISHKGLPDYEASTYGNLVAVKLRAGDWQEYQVLVHFMNMVLQGINVCRHDFQVHPQHVEQVIEAVTHQNEVYKICKPGEIRLLGNDKSVRKVTDALWDHDKRMEGWCKELLYLEKQEFTLLRSFVARFGHDPEKFAIECGLHHARFDGTLKKIVMCGRSSAIKKARALARELQLEQFVQPTSEDIEESCSVCHLPPEWSTGGDAWLRRSHRLVSCDHLHCGSCLMLAVKWASLPLTCFHMNCAAVWVIADVSQVTRDDPELLSSLARRSVEQKIATDVYTPWRPCPIPECAFVWNTNDSAESQGIQVYGELHICPGCTNPVCFRCQTLFHYGRPCKAQESAESTTCIVPTTEAVGASLQVDADDEDICFNPQDPVQTPQSLHGGDESDLSDSSVRKQEQKLPESQKSLRVLRELRKRKSAAELQELSSALSVERAATKHLPLPIPPYRVTPRITRAVEEGPNREEIYKPWRMTSEPLAEIGKDKFNAHGEKFFIPLSTPSSIAECFPSKSASAKLGGKPSTSFRIGEKVYPMTRSPRGLCIIIDNGNFERGDLHRRTHSADGYRMEQLFVYLHFTVRRCTNLTASEMRTAIAWAVRLEAHHNSDCFVLVIISDASGGAIYGVDGQTLNLLHDICRPFGGVNCAALQGKPKLFFLQLTCKEKYDSGSVGMPDSSAYNSVLEFAAGANIHLMDAEMEEFQCSDTLLVMANQEQAEKPLFLSTMYEVFLEYASSLDLQQLLVRVADIISEKYKYARFEAPFQYRTFRFGKALYFNRDNNSTREEAAVTPLKVVSTENYM